MLIEIALTVACIIFVAVITRKDKKRKNSHSSNATHPLDDGKHIIDSFIKAREHYNNKSYKDALRDIDKALDLQPDCKNCLWLRAIIFIGLEQYEEAIQDYDSAIEIAPENAIIYNECAWLKSYMGDYEGAMLDIKKAIALDDTHSYFFSTRGQANWLMQNYDEALDDFIKAIELEDIHVLTLEKSIALLKLNQSIDAITLWREATSEDAEFQSAEAYQDNYRFAPPFYEAMQELEKLAQNTN